MSIRPSSSRQVQECIAALSSAEATARESAVARLIIIGTRAVAALAAVADDKQSATAARIAALRALEGIGGGRSLATALGVLDDASSEVAMAGISVARAALRGPDSVAITDRLAALTLDRARDGKVRVSALRALSDLPAATLDPLFVALKDDPDPALTGFKALPRATESSRLEPSDLLTAAVEELPDDPATLRHAVATAGSTIPVIDLHRLLERVRDREADATKAELSEWVAVRGSIHAALADRESLLGVYDLREALEHGKHPLPVEFVSALKRVGDASCLEPLAASYDRTGGDKLWKRHLAEAFETIIHRLKLTKRSALLKRIQQRHPSILGS